MIIREAAQAFLTAYRLWTPGVNTIKHVEAAEKALDSALAAPPDPGWEEGYRAGKEDAARLAKGWNAAGYPIGCAIEQIPVPSAPTQAARAFVPPRDPVGKSMLHHGDPECPDCENNGSLADDGMACLKCGGAPPAPEAKTAESEGPKCACGTPSPFLHDVACPCYRPEPSVTLDVWIDPDDIGWFDLNGKPMTVYSHPVSTTIPARITVPPAPVEPEETP